jgi:hypothetical protein
MHRLPQAQACLGVMDEETIQVKLTLFDPRERMTPEITADMLLLVGAEVSPVIIARWTLHEQALAYDWACRRHLRASDNNHVPSRPKPWFVTVAETMHPEETDGQE